MSLVPLLILPFLLFNAVLAGLFGGGPDVLAQPFFSVAMISGGTWRMSTGDMLLLLGLVLLFFEILKSTRTSRVSVIDHVLSTGVFILYLVEFLLVAGAAHAVFFLLMVMTLIDVLAGFSVSIRSAGRDVNFG